RQRGVEVVTTLPDDELWVAGEASLLARALINLLDNAVKFAPAGATVNVTVAAAGGMACAHVANPGPPIPPAQMARLFERFTRAGSGPARKADGVGLGLAFVHRVATRLGGTIACTSDAAQGTCFTLTLPRLPD
ncbi:MAG TPA: ATP-binding protein, partial [Novosphingobium sp.]|nr:ATP-binding protein [Novosphingobium sp.]